MKRYRFLLWGMAMTLLVLAFNQWVLAEKSQQEPKTIVWPTDPVTFQPGPGSTLASGYCMMCHSAEYVYIQPPHSPKKWGEIVHKMKHAFGCSIPEEKISTLVAYLVSQNDNRPVPLDPEVQKLTSSPDGHGGDPSKGKVVYESYCVNCHGLKGKGDGPIGQSLIPPAADLTAIGNTSDEDILQIIRKGKPGTAMPSWENDLSSKEVLDVLAYVLALRS